MRADLARWYPSRHLGLLFSGEMTADECWDYVAHLPRESATWAAVYADPETVYEDPEAAAGSGGPAPEPRLTEFSPEAERLADIADRLASLIAIVSGALCKRPVKIGPCPRPGDARRAEARARRDERDRAEWDDLCRQMGVEV